MYNSLFIHSPIERYLGSFQVLAVLNKAVINIFVQDFVWKYSKFLTPLGKYHGVRLLFGMVRICLVL